MKRILLLLLLLLLTSGAALADPLGFGFVNASDVALRREPGGKVILRVPQDACIWISDSQMDSKGKLWYRINTGLHIDHANYDCYGWMMADFIDSGEKLWHDVTAVSCSPFSNGMMALFWDGTAVTASRPIVSADGTEWTNARRMTEQFEPVRQVLVGTGLNFYALDAQGRIYCRWQPDERSASLRFRRIGGTTGNLVGITQEQTHALPEIYGMWTVDWYIPAQAPSRESLSRVTDICCGYDWQLFLTDTGELLAAVKGEEYRPGDHPDWAQWQGLKSIDFGIYCAGDRQTVEGYVYAAVKNDGTALIHPTELQAMAQDWRDLKDIQVGTGFLLALKNDGTVMALSTNGHPAPDVTGWRDIEAIEASTTYCVGLKKDGTLAFAGDVTFMGEGHTRK